MIVANVTVNKAALAGQTASFGGARLFPDRLDSGLEKWPDGGDSQAGSQSSGTGEDGNKSSSPNNRSVCAQSHFVTFRGKSPTQPLFVFCTFSRFEALCR